MSGQSANLSISEAKAMQCRVQAKGSHAETNGGGKKSAPSKTKHESMKKVKE